MLRLIADLRVMLNWSAWMVVSQVTGVPLASQLTTGTGPDSHISLDILYLTFFSQFNSENARISHAIKSHESSQSYNFNFRMYQLNNTIETHKLPVRPTLALTTIILSVVRKFYGASRLFTSQLLISAEYYY